MARGRWSLDARQNGVSLQGQVRCARRVVCVDRSGQRGACLVASGLDACDKLRELVWVAVEVAVAVQFRVQCIPVQGDFELSAARLAHFVYDGGGKRGDDVLPHFRRPRLASPAAVRHQQMRAAAGLRSHSSRLRGLFAGAGGGRSLRLFRSWLLRRHAFVLLHENLAHFKRHHGPKLHSLVVVTREIRSVRLSETWYENTRHCFPGMNDSLHQC